MTYYFKWDEAQTTTLIDLHKAGLDRDAISRAMDIAAIRVKRRLIYLGLTDNRPPIGKSNIDLGQQMHELARLRFSIDECAFALGIDLPKAFELAEWYCVRFDEIPVDTATIAAMLRKGRNYAEIARVFGCSYQKIAAMAKAIRERRVVQ